MKKHYIKMAERFPEGHRRAGKNTNFAQLIDWDVKTHTIRTNYDEKKKMVDEVNDGKAIAVVVTDSGTEISEFTKLGIQRLEIRNNFFLIDNEERYDMPQIWLKNGLNYEDFYSWFSHVQKEPCVDYAIIHFNEFRY